MPCVSHCYDQQEPIFDPSSSSSYSNVSCSSAQCSQNIKIGSTCFYRVRYGDGSITEGFVAKERLTLSSADALDCFLFGCGHYNNGLFGRTARLLGLGWASESLVSQTVQKYGSFFSFCLPTLSGSTGFLSFGSNGGNPNSIKFTNLGQNVHHPSYYYIDIVDIREGSQNLNGYSTVYIPKITFLFCLAFTGNSDDNQIAIHGNYQQQKYQVVYDVAGGRP
ncbi:LOW QUALITY PROTEIN: Xylanase inhibitor, N-terminal, partial [Dillenia turbinata]